MSNAQDHKEQKIEALLQSRRLEPASADLAERIIRKAQSLPQRRAASLSQWVSELFTDFHLPRPAYVLVGTLIVGFVVGFTIPQYPTSTDDADQSTIQSFLYADEDML